MSDIDPRYPRDVSGKVEPTDTELLHRSCEALWGICTGIMADKQLSDDEIKFLDQWLRDNSEIATTWPGEVVYARVRDVLADGVITEDERKHLKHTLNGLIDGTLSKAPPTPEIPAAETIDRTGEIEIPGRSFCFTGTFFFGPQEACERAISRRGGIAIPEVQPQLNYLVVGAMAGTAWIDTDFGRKIELATGYQNQGADIAIIGEEIWTRHLDPLSRA